MLNIDTNLKNKSVFQINPDKNEEIWDLTTSSIRINGADFRFKGIHTIKIDEIMRPDLIAYRKTGDQGKCGSIMKVTGISNPFSLDVGDVLYIPEDGSIERSFENRAKISFNSDSSGNFNSKENSTKRKAIEEFRKKQQSKKFSISEGRKKYQEAIERENNIKNKVANPLPPNILDEGENTIITKSGLIFLAPDSTRPNS